MIDLMFFGRQTSAEAPAERRNLLPADGLYYQGRNANITVADPDPWAGLGVTVRYPVVIEQCDSWFVVECPVLPGCVTQGRTRQEALERIKEAIRGCVQVRRDLGLPILEYDEVVV